MSLPYEFFKLVEQNMKYVVYGDSVAEYCKTVIKINEQIKYISFYELWNTLKLTNNIIYDNEKEYIISPDNIEVLTYDTKIDKLIMSKPQKIIRHLINKEIIRLNMENSICLDITKDHSLIDFNGREWNKITPEEAQYVPRLVKPGEIGYYKELKYLRDNINGTTNNHPYPLINVKPIKIKSKDIINYDGYVYDFDIPETNNFNVNGFIVHNTDSSYINVPQIKPINSQDALEKATEISTEINRNVKSYLDKTLLNKMGIDPIYNYTVFKTELVASAMLLIDAKKNYAYKMIIEEGKILKTPKVKYVGLAVRKSDASKFTKDFIKYLVEDVLFHPDFEYNKFKSQISNFSIEMHNKLKHLINNYEYLDISIPKKWGTNYKTLEPFQINAMRFYNTLIDKPVFKPFSACLTLPLKINNYSDLETKISAIKNKNPFYINDIPIIKISKIAIPYNYEVETIKQIFDYYKISVDFDECWNLLLNKTLLRIIEVSKAVIKK
jgi:hypothetical protein